MGARNRSAYINPQPGILEGDFCCSTDPKGNKWIFRIDACRTYSLHNAVTYEYALTFIITPAPVIAWSKVVTREGSIYEDCFVRRISPTEVGFKLIEAALTKGIV